MGEGGRGIEADDREKKEVEQAEMMLGCERDSKSLLKLHRVKQVPAPVLVLFHVKKGLLDLDPSKSLSLPCEESP